MSVIAYLHNQAAFFLRNENKQKNKKTKYLEYYSPKYFLPFKRFKFIEKANQLINLIFLRIKHGEKKQILWVFDPEFAFLVKAAKLLKIKTIYDCVDDHGHLDKNQNKKIKELEKKLITESDYFFVNSKTLEKKQ